MKNQLESILMQFGENFGIQGLCFDEYQSCMLLIDDLTFMLQSKQEQHTLLIYCPLLELEPDAPKEMLLAILEANCLGAGTHGLHLGLEKDLRVFILSGSMSTTDLSLVELERLIQFFVDEANHWREQLREWQQKPLPIVSAPSELSALQDIMV
jgi:hypothetical protein